MAISDSGPSRATSRGRSESPVASRRPGKAITAASPAKKLQAGSQCSSSGSGPPWKAKGSSPQRIARVIRASRRQRQTGHSSPAEAITSGVHTSPRPISPQPPPSMPKRTPFQRVRVSR